MNTLLNLIVSFCILPFNPLYLQIPMKIRDKSERYFLVRIVIKAEKLNYFGQLTSSCLVLGIISQQRSK